MACLNFEDQEKIESLPDEDPETQAVLMRHVLKVLMEIEQLTPTERASVQHNLADSTSDSDTFTELSLLIPIHFRHQSEEEASSVHVTHTWSTQGKAEDLDLASDETEVVNYLHNPKAAASQDSEQWKLLKKIKKIIKVTSSSEDSESTGLNRHNRWTGKVSAGSSIYATSGNTPSGNAENAQAAAWRLANNVMKQWSSAFTSLKNAKSLASAKISLLVSLTNGSFGLAVIADQLVIVEVLTMYEKSGAKGTKHLWTSSMTSIGALSYLTWQFQAMECATTQTTQFTHLPSSAFLCIVPQDLLPGPFETVLQGLNMEKQAVIAAVKELLRPSRRNRANAINIEDN
ncbi:hypothetical protein EI94DRAFT_1702623 [Lactarius quietus]|nr:hypothetical protein EI94DRAFT_1702623 [Lactarius quietus]